MGDEGAKELPEAALTLAPPSWGLPLVRRKGHLGLIALTVLGIAPSIMPTSSKTNVAGFILLGLHLLTEKPNFAA